VEFFILESPILVTRLRGHRDQITSIHFLLNVSSTSPSTSTSTALSTGYLLTSSKDTFLKLWDLSTQHCIQTVLAHRTEVWSVAVDQEQSTVFTGSNEGELKAWKICREALDNDIKETNSGEVGAIEVANQASHYFTLFNLVL